MTGKNFFDDERRRFEDAASEELRVELAAEGETQVNIYLASEIEGLIMSPYTLGLACPSLWELPQIQSVREKRGRKGRTATPINDRVLPQNRFGLAMFRGACVHELSHHLDWRRFVSAHVGTTQSIAATTEAITVDPSKWSWNNEPPIWKSHEYGFIRCALFLSDRMSQRGVHVNWLSDLIPWGEYGYKDPIGYAETVRQEISDSRDKPLGEILKRLAPKEMVKLWAIDAGAQLLQKVEE
ncbi:MAG: hypothetical protein JWM11_4586 [Planctomycetaceae bacterium]|nr:hypothetical protein [Planctomycetaceae bacterium]